MRNSTSFLSFLYITCLAACGGEQPPGGQNSTLKINEVVSSNEGVHVDEQGELDDWIELVNVGTQPVDLSGFTIADSGNAPAALPRLVIQPGAVQVLIADDSPDQGAHHLPFKLSSSGETLSLYDGDGLLVEQVTVPALDDNEAYARFASLGNEFSVCRYASPGKPNVDECRSAAKPVVTDDTVFQTFPESAWPQSVVPASLVISEVAILPADHIEVINLGPEPVDLQGYELVISAMSPISGPTIDEIAPVSLPDSMIMPGEVVSVGISEAQAQAIVQQPHNEGAVLLVEASSGKTIDQVPFMHWPEGAVLARNLEPPHAFRFCQNSTPDAANECEPVISRALGDRARGLYTPADFATLARGSGLASMESVKFVIDLHMDNAVHYLSAERWPLHYSFVREIIDGDPPLNRCDPVQEQQFNQGWSLFSQENYYNNVTRRFHLGTLSKHANAKVQAVEYTFGDAITPQQMRDAFYLAVKGTDHPVAWSLRPQDSEQVSRARAIEGELPIVGPNAPFLNVELQTLAVGVAYGTLQFIPTDELDTALLGPRVIVVTNDVPNDIDFVGGLITEAFQTPLAHVNILSQGRGTPNLALQDASRQPEVQSLLGKLVRFEVTAGGYTLREASLAEAEEFWANSGQNPDVLVPRLDAVSTALVDLESSGLDALPTIGAKAAQLAELFQLTSASSSCSEGAGFGLPEGAFAIPMYYYFEHFTGSGARAYLESEMASDLFASDLDYRRLVLLTARQMILEHPVNAQLLSEVEGRVRSRYGSERVRFRSSSNTEDLSTFNGAGLYDSLSAAVDDDERRIDVAIRTVWASLWNLRAYEERSYANVDQSQVAMGVLVHRAFRNERANGVAIARNILNPTRTDQYFVNTQIGEASVTNPAPGVITEQVIYQWPPRTPRLTYQSQSSLTESPVLSGAEIRSLVCAMDAIQTHFEQRLDPLGEDRWFTMESEFKFLGPERQFLIKQARPYPLVMPDIPNDCREL